MTASKASSSQRLAWLEGIRIFAAVMILLYHAQLLITNYAYTPQPTGLLANLSLMAQASDRLGDSFLAKVISFPVWFGFQFVDVFVLVSGFALVLSLRGKSLEVGKFLKRRLLRVLWTFWTVAWLSFPILWAIGIATDSYIPHQWHMFAAAAFPLLFQFDGNLLLPSSGPWWFVPLILSFTIIFPFLWNLLHRWGAKNLLWASLLLTIGYRALATYPFEGHPTYVVLETAAGWFPFLPFIAKLSTFVLGMVVAQAYCQGQGPLFWRTRRAWLTGLLLYAIGFLCQFYRLGWVFADLLLPAGLTLLCVLAFRPLSAIRRFKPAFIWLGAHSYSYFLIHNFVVDRTLGLVVQGSLNRYYVLLPVMVVGTLVLAVLADYTTPLLQRIIAAILKDVDYVMTTNPTVQVRAWSPHVGDVVRYRGEGGWTILKVEQLLDDQAVYLCQVSNGSRTIWLSEEDLELEHTNPPSDRNGHSRIKPTFS